MINMKNMVTNKYTFESKNVDIANHFWTVISQFKFENKEQVIEHRFIEDKDEEFNKVFIKCNEDTYLKIQDYIKNKFNDRGYYLKPIF